jgi:hypothetical protein
MAVIDKSNIDFMEYDLNVFYEDLGLDAEDVNQWADVYTIQPSVYINTIDNRALRLYMEAFKLTLAETRAIAPDFPIDFWGDDFFIALDSFQNMCKAMPESLQARLSQLPDLKTLDIDPDASEINWIN